LVSLIDLKIVVRTETEIWEKKQELRKKKDEFGGRIDEHSTECVFCYKFDTCSSWLRWLITAPGYNKINQLTPTPILAQSHSGWISWVIHSYDVQALVLFLLPPVLVHHSQILEH
jgi:hypothetical protein